MEESERFSDASAEVEDVEWEEGFCIIAAAIIINSYYLLMCCKSSSCCVFLAVFVAAIAGLIGLLLTRVDYFTEVKLYRDGRLTRLRRKNTNSDQMSL